MKSIFLFASSVEKSSYKIREFVIHKEKCIPSFCKYSVDDETVKLVNRLLETITKLIDDKLFVTNNKIVSTIDYIIETIQNVSNTRETMINKLCNIVNIRISELDDKLIYNIYSGLYDMFDLLTTINKNHNSLYLLKTCIYNLVNEYPKKRIEFINITKQINDSVMPEQNKKILYNDAVSLLLSVASIEKHQIIPDSVVNIIFSYMSDIETAKVDEEYETWRRSVLVAPISETKEKLFPIYTKFRLINNTYYYNCGDTECVTIDINNWHSSSYISIEIRMCSYCDKFYPQIRKFIIQVLNNLPPNNNITITKYSSKVYAIPSSVLAEKLRKNIPLERL